MKPLPVFSGPPEVWKTIARRLRAAPTLAIFLDYDGTLTPIRRKPSAAVLPPDVRNSLRRMVQHSDVCVAIVTGRAMVDIRKLVRVEGLGFAANHGFHVRIGGIEWIHPKAMAQRQLLSKLHKLLCQTCAAIPEAFIENKQYTLSIHYRNVAADRARLLTTLVSKAVHAYDPTLQITQGKKVVEIRPHSAWGKGDAVLAMLQLSKTARRQLPLFIGDDRTDEDVFRVLQSKGITIRVGMSGPTRAHYCVRNVHEVHKILQLILSLREDRSLRVHSKQVW